MISSVKLDLSEILDYKQNYVLNMEQQKMGKDIFLVNMNEKVVTQMNIIFELQNPN